jgi:hypothetical protein
MSNVVSIMSPTIVGEEEWCLKYIMKGLFKCHR